MINYSINCTKVALASLNAQQQETGSGAELGFEQRLEDQVGGLNIYKIHLLAIMLCVGKLEEHNKTNGYTLLCF